MYDTFIHGDNFCISDCVLTFSSFCAFFRGLIQEYASKVWVAYLDNERRCQTSYAERFPTQIQSVSLLI